MQKLPFMKKIYKLYVGETGRRLISVRFADHLRCVRNNYVDKPLAWHFNISNYSFIRGVFFVLFMFLCDEGRTLETLAEVEGFVKKIHIFPDC